MNRGAFDRNDSIGSGQLASRGQTSNWWHCGRNSTGPCGFAARPPDAVAMTAVLVDDLEVVAMFAVSRPRNLAQVINKDCQHRSVLFHSSDLVDGLCEVESAVGVGQSATLGEWDTLDTWREANRFTADRVRSGDKAKGDSDEGRLAEHFRVPRRKTGQTAGNRNRP